MATGAVDAAVERARVTPTTRATFQAVALLVRELREQTKTAEVPEFKRAEQMKRIDGLATALARTAARDGSLLGEPLGKSSAIGSLSSSSAANTERHIEHPAR